MPIKVQNDLPVKEILEEENIFVMDEERSVHQDIRALEILILNLMPKKEETELQLLRCLSNTPMQVNVTLGMVGSHESKNTSSAHLNKFYEQFDELKKNKYDGMIITGAPVELLEFEEVDYWNEICRVFEWTKTNVTSTLHLCWGAQAALYYHYGIKKYSLPEKLSGLFWHTTHHKKCELVRGFDDSFLVPHSRHTDVDITEVEQIKDMTVLAKSKEAGLLLSISENGKKIFMMGHPEYDRLTLDEEFKRDTAKGLGNVKMPVNYYPDNDPKKQPLLTWRAISNAFYSNWINYYIYQTTPYILV